MSKNIIAVGLFLLFMLSFNFAITDLNLYSYYNFDETSGTVLIDSLNDNNGVNSNATVNQAGLIGKAYQFVNASSSKVTIANESNYDFITDTTQDFTACFWINHTTNVDFGTYISKGSYPVGWWVSGYYTGDDRVQYNFYEDGSNSELNQKFGTTFQNGDWNLVCQVRTGATSTIYFDLNTIASETITGTGFATVDVAQALTLGWDNQAGHYYQGYLDELSVWKRALTLQDINDLYNDGNGIPYPFLPYSGVDANFDYTIKEITETIDFNDTSIITGAVEINDWNWIINDVIESTNQNFSYATSAYEDVNACLEIDSNIGGHDYKCNQFNTGSLTGRITINTYDENSALALYNTNINFNGTDYNASNTMDINTTLTNTTSSQYTFTLTKTGYGTRYYEADLNKYSDLNITFALLPTSLSENIPLKVYETDETTIFDNTYVQLYLPDKNNWIVGQRKTDLAGETTFNLHTTDQNYYANINNGEFVYQPVALTIAYPKNEETLDQIDEDWKIDITQNLYVSYTDLNAEKVIYLLPNTADPYNIKIGDMNGNYFNRTYAQQYPGNPLADTLQPYLVPTTSGLLTTITTKNASTNTVVDGITIKIYKYISGIGRTLVEQVITDAKGQALVLLVLNGEYEFETYQDSVFLKIYNITATSSTIWLMLPVQEPNIPTSNPSGFKASFTPISTGLAKTIVGSQPFTQTLNNYAGLNYTYTSIVTQNGVVLATETGSSSDVLKTFSHSVLWSDINKGNITSSLTIIVGTNTYNFEQSYSVNDAFGTNVDLLSVLSTGLRSDATCSATGVCFPLLVIGLILSIAIAILASATIGNLSGQSAGILFLIPMILFTYITWIPYELTVGIVIILLAFLINERRQ